MFVCVCTCMSVLSFMCAGPAEVEFLDAHYLRRLLTLQSVDDLVRETFGLQTLGLGLLFTS